MLSNWLGNTVWAEARSRTVISIREHLHPPQMQGFRQICSPGPLPIQSCEFRLAQGGCSKLARSRGAFVDRVCVHACAGTLWKTPGQVLGKPPSEFALHMLPVYIHDLLNSLWFGSLKPCVRRVSTLPLSSSPAPGHSPPSTVISVLFFPIETGSPFLFIFHFSFN